MANKLTPLEKLDEEIMCKKLHDYFDEKAEKCASILRHPSDYM